MAPTMTTQTELARAFAQGATSGTASNMEIRENGDGSTLLVGYGWAVYARRTADGEILYHGPAWAEWARERGGQATQGQLAQVRHGFRKAGVEYDTIETLVRCDDPPASVSMVGVGVLDR